MEKEAKFIPDRELKLLDQVRETLRYCHYAFSTEKTYCQWILRYICFYDKKRHPLDMGAREVERVKELHRRDLEQGFGEVYLPYALAEKYRNAAWETNMLEKGINIRVLQDLLGHADVKTTELYTHVMQKDLQALQNPLDRLYSRKQSIK